MLPLIVNEDDLSTFKFWFNENLQEGMHHRNELFCRLQIFDIRYRSLVYHLGCKLAQQGSVVVLSCGLDTCSLWASLRDPITKRTLVEGEPLILPQVKSATVEGLN